MLSFHAGQCCAASGRCVSLASMSALVVQNTALVLLMKFSFRDSSQEYSTASVVVAAELLKFFICAAYVSITSYDGPKNALIYLWTAPREVGLAVPCILYVIQNNLLFEAVRNLPTSVYVVCSQGKILTSAFFSYVYLGSRVSNRQVLGLLVLVVGLVLVQMPADANERHSGNSNLTRGIVSVLCACCSSGYAGVLLEKMYKKQSGSHTVLSRNMQLSCYSIPVSIAVAVSKAGFFSEFGEFLAGYDGVVFGIVILQAGGGLITALVMRHASTVLKCFAISISISICTLVSSASGQEKMTVSIAGGVILVILATFVYSS